MPEAEPITQEKVLALWSDLVKNPQVHWPGTPLSLALDLFSDAVKSFAANARLGAAVLCRATIDTACLISLTYLKAGEGDHFRIDLPRGLDGKVREVYWEELRGGIAGVLNEREMARIKRIRDHGNVPAHLGDKYLKWIEAALLLNDPLEAERRRPFASQTDVWEDLQETARILERLCVTLYGS